MTKGRIFLAGISGAAVLLSAAILAQAAPHSPMDNIYELPKSDSELQSTFISEQRSLRLEGRMFRFMGEFGPKVPLARNLNDSELFGLGFSALPKTDQGERMGPHRLFYHKYENISEDKLCPGAGDVKPRKSCAKDLGIIRMKKAEQDEEAVPPIGDVRAYEIVAPPSK